MIPALIYAGVLVGAFIYHRWKLEDPPDPTGAIEMPRTAEGSVVPVIYGTARVRSSLVVFYGNPTNATVDGVVHYTLDVLFVLGIPFRDGRTRLDGVFFGEIRSGTGVIDDSAANLGGTPYLAEPDIDSGSPQFIQFDLEFGSGSTTQSFDTSAAAGRMVTAGWPLETIPAFRNYATVFGTQIPSYSQALPALSFEISTFPNAPLSNQQIGGADANPADVIYDILKGEFGKLGITSTYIDGRSFRSCAAQLNTEGHGYSRCVETSVAASDLIMDILTQIDGVLYEDPADGLIKIRLIRSSDADASTMVITPENCESIDNFAAGGWTDLANRIRIIFTNRADGYQDGSAVAHNQANAVGQDGVSREVVLRFPGVCTQALADVIASRELSARSRPIAKCRATVGREFWRTVQGDPVIVNWPEYNIVNMIFRVANVSRGVADSNVIVLDLIQDFFYTYRKLTHDTSGDAPPYGGGDGGIFEG